MSTHASDVAIRVRDAVKDYPMVGDPSEFHMIPNPEQSWPNRDGRHEFVVATGDCLRGFRVTVEAIFIAEAFELKDEYDDAWAAMNPERSL